MRAALARALQALGLAAVVATRLLYPLVDPHHELVYHLHDGVTRLFGAVLLDVLLFSAVFYLGLLAASRLGRAGAAIQTLLLLMIAPVLYLEGHTLELWRRLPVAEALYACGSLVVMAAFVSLPARWRGFGKLAQMVFLFAGLSGAVTVLQAVFFWHSARAIEIPVPPNVPAGQVGRAGGGRVIWLLLDELSYEQIFERRFPGLELPAFDALAKQATNFTNVVPAGISTQEVVPSLLTGTQIDRVELSARGGLVAVHDQDTGQWRRFDPQATVVADARRAGYSTSIDGWYNPYCRVLATVLDHCAWSFHLARVVSMRPDLSLWQNVLQPFRSAARAVLRAVDRTRKPNAERTSHIDDYLDLRAAAHRSLADPSQRFLFIHMPVPHPLSMYKRATGQLDARWGSYLDNLKLADIYLGEVRQQLERQGEWDSTTLIVMGDHSWRTQQLWVHSEMWTAEDIAASHGGHFDSRPGYVVRLPGQQTGSRVDCAFPALQTRALLDRLLLRQIGDADALRQWACGAR